MDGKGRVSRKMGRPFIHILTDKLMINTHHRKAELQCGIYSTLSTRCVGCICYSDNVWSDRLQGETWSSLQRECPLVQHSTIQLDSQHRSHCAYCTQH